jgi:hypothetical protein
MFVHMVMARMDGVSPHKWMMMDMLGNGIPDFLE